MKKILIVVAIILLILGGISLVGQSKTDNKNNTPIIKRSSKKIDLSALQGQLKAQYPTVKETYIYSEDRDPNGNLSKEGYYIAGLGFYDTRTDWEPTSSDFGVDSGGAVEVYKTSEDAKKRIEYLKVFQGNSLLDPGALKQKDNIVIRVSSKYTATQQSEMLSFIESLL